MASERTAWLEYLALTVVVVCVAIVAFDGVLGYFMMPAILGAGGVAIMLIAFGHRSDSAVQVADEFHDVPPTDVINISRVRVSGIGGLGLVVIAGLMAFEYTRVAVTLALGLAGGLLIALFLIRQRRRQPGAAVGGPGGRSAR